MTFTIHTTTSKDGTTIGYRQIGTGKGLIISHGAGRISQNYEKLATLLSNNFTVYIPDRRGRGLSGDEGANYDINKAVEDMIAVIQSTGADFIFGHSGGGLIALETMLVHPVKKLAVYEPPISVNHSLPSDWLIGFETAIEKKNLKRAMAILLKGLQMLEGMNKMPIWMIMGIVHFFTFLEKKKEIGILDLLPTITADMKMAIQLDSKYERYNSIDIPVNLMIGSKSPSYFLTGVNALSATLRQSTVKIFENHDHSAPEENVIEIADNLKLFYRII